MRLVLAVALAALVPGCKPKTRTGGLRPPEGAPAWESRYGVAFDDAYTRESINLVGRAPHDVRDQQLFAARLGHADIVATAIVQQVWGQGRYSGDQDQYLEVRIGDVLMGELPKHTNDEQVLEVAAHDELAAALRGQEMILFVRWAPGEDPPYHHHLMPADPALVGYIRSLVHHAQAEGVLDESGNQAGDGKRKRKPKAAKRRRGGRAAAEVSTDDDIPAP